LRACDPARLVARRLVVRIGGGAFEPHVAAFEVFVLPDRNNLLDALDRVTARGEGVGAMW